MHTTNATTCGHQRDGHTCNLAPHAAEIDHAETARTASGFPYLVAFWNDGTGITGLDTLVVTDANAREIGVAVTITPEDSPATGDCATCGASHVFDTLADATEWQETHGELGHHVEIASAS